MKPEKKEAKPRTKAAVTKVVNTNSKAAWIKQLKGKAND